MRYITFLFALSVFPEKVSGDACSDFCVSHLGLAACSFGSYCNNAHHCHALFWKTADKTNICIYRESQLSQHSSGSLQRCGKGSIKFGCCSEYTYPACFEYSIPDPSIILCIQTGRRTAPQFDSQRNTRNLRCQRLQASCSDQSS